MANIVSSLTDALVCCACCATQIQIPGAYLQDLLPAAQVISSTSKQGRDYGAAKGQFLSVLHEAGLQAEDLRLQVGGTGACHNVVLSGPCGIQVLKYLNSSPIDNTDVNGCVP